ncbi:xylulokinase [Halomonas sp. SpR8]|uniref:xylulokinase n=1 Tax=Halomonas sp. SpR8 TaxID=3050463 RepID=UPI0027E51EA2|nr:xylulokinase [Halomonas sp. SpR8]MDQ7730566.1 xylulokinase [Halomonas sp. SpR8]
MSTQTYLGLDIGTSAVKGVLVDTHQLCLATASSAYSVTHPHAGWAEQDPELWWQAVEEVVAQLRRQADAAMAKVAGIGLSGQMHGLVVQSQHGEVIRPAILWNDSRASQQCQQLKERLPELDVATITSVEPMPAFWAAKLLWLKAHEPEMLANAHHFLLPKDYVRWRMSGERITDMCDAAGTQLFDQARRAWSPEILAACGVAERQLPNLAEGSTALAALNSDIAARWGIENQVPIAAGAGDVAAGALGLGAINEGDAFFTLGTSSQLFIATSGYRPAPKHALHAFAHALPERWFQMAAMLNGASVLAWAAKLMGVSIDEALAAAEKQKGSASSLLFLPYLNGERTPHNDPDARGVLFGLHPSSGVGEVIQAVLEGVGFSLREARDVIEQAGTPIARLTVIGGGSRSDYWLQLLADILERPIARCEESESGPAFGAARLARLAVTQENPEAVCQPPRIEKVFEPNSENHSHNFERYKRLYRALSPEFAIASKLDN